MDESSNLDAPIDSFEDDEKDIVEAIQNNEFIDELNIPQIQYDRIANEVSIKEIVENLLELLMPNGYPITGDEYNALSKKERNQIKNCFSTIFVSSFRNTPPLRVPLFKGKAYARARSCDYDLTGVVQRNVRIVYDKTIKTFQFLSVRHHRLYRPVSVRVSYNLAHFFFHLLCLFSCNGNSFPNTSKYTCLRSSKVGK